MPIFMNTKLNPDNCTTYCRTSEFETSRAKVSAPIRLLFDQLRDLYSMEIQLAGSLPFLADHATHPGLRDLIAKQSYRTYRRKVQLLVIFRCHEMSAGTDKCRVIERLVKDVENHLQRIEDPKTKDLLMFSHCLRTVQYGITGYGIASGLASRLGFTQEAEALSLLMSEEEAATFQLREIEADVFDLAQRKEQDAKLRRLEF
jgi:ferritin-like metal-binding protein YciE